MRMPDNPDRVYQGRKELLDLMRRKPPLGDIDILVFLDATLDPLEHGVPDEIVGMWERAIIAYPANAALLAGTWFERRFFSGDWKVAKKVRKPHQSYFDGAQSIRLLCLRRDIRKTNDDTFSLKLFATISIQV